jgi:hypothetical protein
MHSFRNAAAQPLSLCEYHAQNGGLHMVARSLAELRQEYRPYDTLPAFHQGFAAYGQQQYEVRNPYADQPHNSVDAIAWDRGRECAERWAREHRS